MWIKVKHLIVTKVGQRRNLNSEQDLWPLKPLANNCNISTQHIATLLRTCCTRLATLLEYVTTCCVLLLQVWKWSNFSANIFRCCHPRTQGLRSAWPTVVKQATLKRSDLKSGNSGLPVELRMPSFQMDDRRTPWNFTSSHLYYIVFQTNQYWSCNGTFEISSSLRSKEQRLEVRDWDVAWCRAGWPRSCNIVAPEHVP